MKMKKHDEAIKDCDSSINCDEKYFKSYLRRGKIREEMEDFDGAIYDYKKVQDMD
tara:strand:- start:292 stop:456 length:165 start_codon:yes stop_codon:yes gene_type:complete